MAGDADLLRLLTTAGKGVDLAAKAMLYDDDTPLLLAKVRASR
jgi:hypothetical protein